MSKRRDKDNAPEGGWLGPPPQRRTAKLAPIAIAKTSRNGKWVWKDTKLTTKEKEAHAKFQKKMKKADQQKEWNF